MSPLPHLRAAALALTGIAVSGLAALPAVAAQPMTASEFESYTDGRTLYFYSAGRAYGVERYKPGRKVVWSFLDGECKDGEWYQEGQFICFVYEDNPEPQCWLFYREDGGLRALFEGTQGETELYEAGEADEPMQCLGPEVGV